ncbi:MAG TPA: cysteine hydrolase [Acholeplasmataceae bacterium]|jgi:nicotinamidase/pyrazinamidase|nr:cysteine hydrolase [Acholeplasmataceae bacterium]
MRLLIIVDFQNDFVDGALGFPEAKFLENKIYEKAKGYDNIVFTLDTHDENYLNTQEGKNLPIKHCIRDSEGWQLYGKIKELSGKKFIKNTFGSDELFEYLKNSNYQEIEIVGLVSNICVIANAVLAKTALPEAQIIVDASCTDSYDKALHEKALDVMEGMQIKIINRG